MTGHRDRLTLGILINTLETEYQRQLWQGAEEAAKENDVNLLIFAGGLFDSSDPYEVQRSLVSRFLSAESIDGLIVVSTILSSALGSAGLFEQIRSVVGDLPIINLGHPHPEYPSIGVDNAEGMRLATQHLITTHGRRQFVFMGAPEGNSDGESRKRAFLETLKDNGLEPVAGGQLVGNFSYEHSRKSLSDWLEQGIAFDAVMAANDEMALGCLDALSEAQVAVPSKVSVVGFDDAPASAVVPLPLTTVSQPIGYVATRAVELLIATLRGRDANLETKVPTTLVVRQSCGCAPSPQIETPTPRPVGRNRAVLELEASRKNQNLTMRLSRSFTMDSLASTLDVQLPAMGVKSCSILIFEPQTNFERCREVYALRPFPGPPPSSDQASFPTRQIFANPLTEASARHSYVIESLFYGEQQLGLLLLARDSDRETVDGILSAQIRGAVKAAILVEELKSANDQLRRQQEKLVLSEKMAVLSVLVSGLSHEINTPIGIAVTASSYLGELISKAKERLQAGQFSGGPVAEFLDDLNAANALTQDGLEKTVNLVKSFRRISVDLSSDEQRDFQVTPYLKEVADTLAAELNRHEAKMVVEGPADLWIRSDPSILYQIVAGLAMNSLHHGFSGEPGGVIRVRVAGPVEGQLQISFEDTGIGLSPERLSHLFEPFYGSMANRPGSGLGTFVIYNLVTHHLKGTITAKSKPGQGLRYEIRFPIALAPAWNE